MSQLALLDVAAVCESPVYSNESLTLFKFQVSHKAGLFCEDRRLWNFIFL